jgi:membrane protein
MTLFPPPHSNYETLPPPGSELTDQHRPLSEAAPGELAGYLAEQVTRLVRAEVALAQLEAKRRAKRLALAAGMFGTGGLFLFFGACCGVAAAIIGLANVVQPWLSAVIIGAASMIFAILVVLPGWKGLNERRGAIPPETVENLKADLAAAKNALRR